MSGRERVWFVDRMDGDVVVLLDERGVSHEVTRAVLPEDAREGSRIVVSVAPPQADTSALRQRLSKDDDGGDIAL